MATDLGIAGGGVVSVVGQVDHRIHLAERAAGDLLDGIGVVFHAIVWIWPQLGVVHGRQTMPLVPAHLG